MPKALLNRLLRRPTKTSTAPRRPLAAVIDVRGRVGAEAGMVSLDALSPHIDHAFTAPRPDIVVLRINCNGGAPAQAEMIHRRIRSLAELLSVPVVASVEDAATSAGYWIALAADEIIGQNTSLIGSVGTCSYQFGFEKLLARIGVDRRVLASGPDKALGDPFAPETDHARELAEALQADIRTVFQRVVVASRGARLRMEIETISRGTTWSGMAAQQLGLIDEVQDLRVFLARRFRAIPEIRIHNAGPAASVDTPVPSLGRIARALNNLVGGRLKQSLGAAFELE